MIVWLIYYLTLREESHKINNRGKKRNQKDPKLLMKAKKKAKTVLKKETLISKF